LHKERFEQVKSMCCPALHWSALLISDCHRTCPSPRIILVTPRANFCAHCIATHRPKPVDPTLFRPFANIRG
jgi:hypothetical protein